MKIHFYGGAGGWVTGAHYLLETAKGNKILIDCGLFQGGPRAEELNRQPFAYQPNQLKAVLLTHAHNDHLGRLPCLVKAGFQGKIYSTRPTKALAEPVLWDSQKINQAKAEEANQPLLYSQADLEKTLKLFEGIEYNQLINLTEDVSFVFQEAGHILGSAIIQLLVEGKKVVFSGDLGNPPVPLLRPFQFIDQADYLVVESAYGNRVHEDKDRRRDILEDVIEDVVYQKGVLLIPSFALERTQEILYEMNQLAEHQRIPPLPIFLDSPLAIKLTSIYQQYQDYFNQEAAYLIKSGDQIFDFPGLEMTETVEQSKEINEWPAPKVIIAGSGMSEGGRILHHELRYLPDSQNIILFIGYQVKGSLGRQIFDRAKQVKIFGQKVPVRLKTRAIGGYSAHADQPTLLNWIRPMKRGLKKVFVVQGEEEAAQALAQAIMDHLGLAAEVPILNQVSQLP